MNIKTRILLLLGVSVMALLGCREVRYYGYKDVELDVLGGKLLISVKGKYGENYQKDNKKYLDWGFPYRLQFWISMPPENDLYMLEVRNIELVGERSHHQHRLSDCKSSKVRIHNDPKPEKSVRCTVEGITSDIFSYEPYFFKASIFVYENINSYKEQTVSLKLEEDFRKERQCDWFDELMSP